VYEAISAYAASLFAVCSDNKPQDDGEMQKIKKWTKKQSSCLCCCPIGRLLQLHPYTP
jgi:hypothetical protein